MAYTKNTKQNPTDNKIYGVYIKSLLTMKIMLSIGEIGKNVKQNLEKKIVAKNEGRCIAEGYIRPNSVKIVSYSSGIVNSEFIEFHTVFECMVCHPVEGMLIECETKTITKAGIHAEVVTEGGIVPVTVFVARDHNYKSDKFNSVKENTKITVKVIGIRYELNDPYICVIGKLADTRQDDGRAKRMKGGLFENDDIDQVEVVDLDAM
jgi:DNA-directed RNA polymerase subunit E'/Rpb7